MTVSHEGVGRQSLTIDSARLLATTTKSAPQYIGSSPRWLVALLPWRVLEAGTFRVNRLRVVAPPPSRPTRRGGGPARAALRRCAYRPAGPAVPSVRASVRTQGETVSLLVLHLRWNDLDPAWFPGLRFVLDGRNSLGALDLPDKVERRGIGN